MAIQEEVEEVLQRLQLQRKRTAEIERMLAIEETRAKTSEPESVLILSPVTMRLERGGAMVKNGKGIDKPNSFQKVSSQSVVLEERECERDRRNTKQKK